MIRFIDHQKMGRSALGWLDSHFHFSFANYYNPENMQFGPLRVVNDDIIEAQTGFDTHPHRDMEIISYVIAGELSHKDSLGNEGVVSPGSIQYISAGTGIYHSEYNHGAKDLRFLQIWIYPDEKNYRPNYGDYTYPLEDRQDNWLHLVSGYKNPGAANIQIHADVNIYASLLSKGEKIVFPVKKDRQAYLILIEGNVKINEFDLEARDALETVERDIEIFSKTEGERDAHLLVIEMPKA